MSRDDIIRLAKEAGMVTTLAQMGAASLVYTDGCDGVALGELERFAALVAAHEREECAKVCDAQVQRSLDASVKAKSQRDQAMYRSAAQTAEWNAAAIRARGNP